MNPVIHSHAHVEKGANIGPKTRIWAFVHILPGASIGENCNICDHVFIENDVIIGNNVTIKCGVQLWDGARIEDNVFIGPNATFTNDIFPPSQNFPEDLLMTHVQKSASIGANATILPGVTIGQKAMVGAGAVVTRSVPPFAIVVGNPAKIIGYVDVKEKAVEPTTENFGKIESRVNGVFFRQIKNVTDLRGDIVVTEFEKDLPFKVKRIFFISNVLNERVRGEHAHKELHEFIICLRGRASVVVDNGETKEEFLLDNPQVGVYIKPKIWRTLYKFSRDAMLVVYASHEYDPNDYIRNYDEFLEIVENT